MKSKHKTARKKPDDSLPILASAIKGIEEKKGNEIVTINLKKNINSPCDYFVICEANSTTQVQAIAGSVEELIKKETGTRPWHVEGLRNAEWVLIDYINVVVHIFQPHVRQHFSLEDMWADADIKKIEYGNAPAKRKSVVKAKNKKPVKKKSSVAKRTIKRKAKSKK